MYDICFPFIDIHNPVLTPPRQLNVYQVGTRHVFHKAVWFWSGERNTFTQSCPCPLLLYLSLSNLPRRFPGLDRNSGPGFLMEEITEWATRAVLGCTVSQPRQVVSSFPLTPELWVSSQTLLKATAQHFESQVGLAWRGSREEVLTQDLRQEFLSFNCKFQIHYIFFQLPRPNVRRRPKLIRLKINPGCFFNNLSYWDYT